MPTPRPGDVIVRCHGYGTVAFFVLVEPVAEEMLSGPFTSLSAAFTGAQEFLASDGRVWQQQLDIFGRSTGPPIPLPTLNDRAVSAV